MFLYGTSTVLPRYATGTYSQGFSLVKRICWTNLIILFLWYAVVVPLIQDYLDLQTMYGKKPHILI